MRASKEAAADWRPRRHQMANTQSHFSLRTNANTIETIIQFYGERMGHEKARPQFPTRPLIERRSPKVSQPVRNQPTLNQSICNRSIRASSRADSKKPVRRTRQALDESEFGMSKHNGNGQTNRGSSIRTRP